jgi:adenine-specific DNA-methyltransferase
MSKKQKLELTWVGKDERVKLEPRVLVEDQKKSYGERNCENMLIYGDNLLSLKALEQDFTGKIKCIYIDPPYNTGNAFTHYDDGLEHSIWLNLLRDRIELLRKLLSPEGSIWISIDDYEVHYLKVMCDEIFGRQNFVSTIIWQQRTTRENRKTFSNNHEYILLYAREYSSFVTSRNALGLTEDVKQRYKNPDNDPKGPWQSVSANAQAGHGTATQFYTLIAPNGKQHNPPPSRCWLYTKDRMDEKITNGEIWFGKNGNGAPRIKKYLSEATNGLTPETLWLAKDVGTNDHAKKNLISMFKSKEVFDTPKPESLIHQIICIATNPSDFVLDSFAGSGTTGAVAHKMNRKWIMCELGEHCHTHIIPRMQKVIDGIDQGGISKMINWKGGGGFKYYRLAESLLVKDKDLSTDNQPVYIINPRYDETLLIKSICKIENFRYRNDGRLHGISSENRFLHVTTRILTQAYLQSLAEDIGKDQSLLIYCTRKSRYLRLPDNVEIKKIPKNLLEKCDFEEDKK